MFTRLVNQDTSVIPNRILSLLENDIYGTLCNKRKNVLVNTLIKKILDASQEIQCLFKVVLKSEDQIPLRERNISIFISHLFQPENKDNINKFISYLGYSKCTKFILQCKFFAHH